MQMTRRHHSAHSVLVSDSFWHATARSRARSAVEELKGILVTTTASQPSCQADDAAHGKTEHSRRHTTAEQALESHCPPARRGLVPLQCTGLSGRRRSSRVPPRVSTMECGVQVSARQASAGATRTRPRRTDRVSERRRALLHHPFSVRRSRRSPAAGGSNFNDAAGTTGLLRQTNRRRRSATRPRGNALSIAVSWSASADRTV